jgi:hypothetical protein
LSRSSWSKLTRECLSDGPLEDQPSP